jgi:hypothetical protein
MVVPARILAVGVGSCVVAVLAYCGAGISAVASRPAPEPGLADLVRSMQRSVREAGSVRVTGHLTQNGTVLAVDLGLRRNGDMTGVIVQNGARAEVVAVAGRIYVRATPAFLKQADAPAGSCAAVCGKWIQPALPEAQRIAADMSMTNITSRLTSGRVPALTESGTTMVQGQRAWVLRAADGSTLDVSAGSRPYPLEAAGSGSPRQVIIYSAWNRVPRPAMPPASQVVMSDGMAGTGGLQCWLCLPDRREDL